MDNESFEDKLAAGLTIFKQLAEKATEGVISIAKQPWFQGAAYLAEFSDTELEQVLRIGLLKHCFILDEQNPIYAWKGLAIADKYDLPLPEWAALSIASSAQRVIDVDVKTIKTSLPRALNLSGHSINKLASIEENFRWFDVVEEYMRENGCKKTTAITEVSEREGFPETSLRVIYNQLDKLLNAPGLPSPFSKDLSR